MRYVEGSEFDELFTKRQLVLTGLGTFIFAFFAMLMFSVITADPPTTAELGPNWTIPTFQFKCAEDEQLYPYPDYPGDPLRCVHQDYFTGNG